jgi:hypothetical protein
MSSSDTENAETGRYPNTGRNVIGMEIFDTSEEPAGDTLDPRLPRLLQKYEIFKVDFF